MSDPCAEGHDFETWRGRDICVTCGYTETQYVKKPGVEEHDRMCPAKNKQISSPITCTYCQLIRQVRLEYQR